MAVNESIVFWHRSQGFVPNGTADPWQLNGPATSTLVDGALEVVDASVIEVETYTHKLWPTDIVSTKKRYADRIWAQFSGKGLAQVPGWASGASPIGFFIDDGLRALGVSIGPTLRLINPTTGDILLDVQSAWPWLFFHDYLLYKGASERWILAVDGKVLAELPYERAAGPAGPIGRVGVGSLDVAGTSTSHWRQFEAGLNIAIPPEWKAVRELASLPVPMQSNWTDVDRAALRSSMGLVENVLRALEDAWFSITASRIDDELRELPGTQIPPTGWTELNAPNLSFVRERLRVAGPGTVTTGVRATFSPTTLPLPDGVEYTGAQTVTVRSFTVDAQGRVGPYLRVHNGHRRVTAELVELVAGGQWAWVLTDGALTGALVILGIDTRRVDPRRATRVEVQILGREWVLLLVDDQICDRRPYTAFPLSGLLDIEFAAFGQFPGPAGPVAVFDLEHLVAVRRLTDVSRRPVFLQNLVERLIFVGGCERNDELDTWARHHHEVQANRGTTTGILIEMRRLSCNEDAFVVRDRVPGSWFLEVSYPEVTPIWLEFDGYLADVFVEFGIGSINFSPEALAKLAAFYLVPLSTVDLEYFICFAAVLTAPAFLFNPITTELPVVSSEGFEVGDVVTVRTANNATHEDSTILTIFSPTQIHVVRLGGAYLAGAVVRKILAHT